ncbi:MAG: DUF134 domain-containing protein [Candidatus Methanomethyliaceae archaeon]|nr:DUF134 domain-containing protein [Candidatus Methanomethyliaceae archaeon]
MISCINELGMPVNLDLAELEALRLVELKISYDNAGMVARVSRKTIWRLEVGKKEAISAL